MRQPRRECLDAIHRAKREFGDTDIYDIYEDVCRYDSGCGESAPCMWGAHNARPGVRISADVQPVLCGTVGQALGVAPSVVGEVAD